MKTKKRKTAPPKKRVKPAPKKTDSLTAKQKVFCDEYLVDMNATRAAIAAGYSEKTAAVIGCENLIKPNIQKYISEQQSKRAEKLGLTKELVLKQLQRIGFFDIKSVYDKSGLIKPIHELSDDAAAAIGTIEIESVSVGRGKKQTMLTTKRIKPKDSINALRTINQMMGWNDPDRLDITTKGESLNGDVSNLSNDEKLQLLRLRQKMRDGA